MDVESARIQHMLHRCVTESGIMDYFSLEKDDPLAVDGKLTVRRRIKSVLLIRVECADGH